jgi:thiol-disulfide isomerase/thioredoxin
MKTKMIATVAALLLTASPMTAKEKKNTSKNPLTEKLTGVWQMCRVLKTGDGEKTILYAPMFKVLNADGTFFNLQQMDDKSPGALFATGTWEVRSEATYAECLTSISTDPSSQGKENIMTFRLTDNDEILHTNYTMPGNGANGQETWHRVEKGLSQVIAMKEYRGEGKLFNADIELADTAGVSHSLAEVIGSGRYILVDFWASWCGPCIAEMPNVKAAYERFHAKGFDVVGLSFDANADAWKAAINRFAMPWANLSDLKGWESAAAKKYKIHSIPDNILVGPDGRIVANGLRGDALQQKLAELLGE